MYSLYLTGDWITGKNAFYIYFWRLSTSYHILDSIYFNLGLINGTWISHDSDSAVGEQINLTVLPVAQVQFPAMAGYFKGFFPGWSMSRSPLDGTKQPVEIEEEGRKFNYTQTMAETKKNKTNISLNWSLSSVCICSIGVYFMEYFTYSTVYTQVLCW